MLVNASCLSCQRRALYLDLVDRESVDPRHKPRERGLACTTHTNKQEMPLQSDIEKNSPLHRQTHTQIHLDIVTTIHMDLHLYPYMYIYFLFPLTYLFLLEDPIYPEHMIQDLIEEHQRDIQFLLIEDLETSLHVVTKLLPLHGEVILGQPVAVQDRTTQGNLPKKGEGENKQVK